MQQAIASADAFAELYWRHLTRVYRYHIAYVGNIRGAIQPAWHFQGHYADGSGFDVLIQALKQEFLLPDLAPYAGMG